MLSSLKASLFLATLIFSSSFVIASPAQQKNSISQNTVKCNPSGTTVEMKKCAQDRYDTADKKLNQVYQQISSQLTGEEKKRLVEAEKAWINFRDLTCKLESAKALGGTLEGLLYTGCLERVTSERTTYLQNYWKQRNSGGTRSDSNTLPQVATIKSLVSGDLMCYATLVDEKNTERQVGASFEICEKKTQFLNKKVRLTYSLTNVNDCQSSEPCGKTRKEMLITRMEVVR